MAKTAELDTELVNGLKAAKSKRAYFALVLKGSNDGALIVSKTKVPPAAITEAKKQSGGSAVLKGFCVYEEGTYVFETAKQAPATAAQAVKVIAKRDAGLAVKAEFRISTDPELLADEGDATATAPPKAPPAPPQPDGAEVIKRLNAMTADIKTALAGPNKAQVQALYVAISGQIKGKAFVDAGKRLDELQKLLKQRTPTAPPPPGGADVVSRLNAMTADIKLALAGPNKAPVQSLYVAISGQIKNKDFVQASKGLDELEPLLKPLAGASAADSAAEWKKKLADWTPAIKAAIVAKGSNAAGVAKLMAQASALSKPGGDMAQALAKLTECHDLATGDAGGPRGAAQAGSAVDLTEVAKRWRAARDQVSADLEKFRKALLADPDIKADPRFSFIRAAAAEVLNMLPPTRALNAGLASGDPAKVLPAIEKYRNDLAAASAFARVEAYAAKSLGLKLAARESLTTAMADMETTLATMT